LALAGIEISIFQNPSFSILIFREKKQILRQRVGDNKWKAFIIITRWAMTNRHNIHLAAVLFLPLLASGCIGLGVIGPHECQSDVPLINYTYNKDKWGPKYKSKDAVDTFNYLQTKDEFIKSWGTPDKILYTSDNEMTLEYIRNSWCGIMPAFIVIVPLILPVCDGFDRITFKGDNATHIHFKRTDGFGIIFPFLVSGSLPCPGQASNQ